VVLVEVEREPCPLAALDGTVNPPPVLHSCGFINSGYIWKSNAEGGQKLEILFIFRS
jgi:hypothetical protein